MFQRGKEHLPRKTSRLPQDLGNLKFCSRFPQGQGLNDRKPISIINDNRANMLFPLFVNFITNRPPRHYEDDMESNCYCILNDHDNRPIVL